MRNMLVAPAKSLPDEFAQGALAHIFFHHEHGLPHLCQGAMGKAPQPQKTCDVPAGQQDTRTHTYLHASHATDICRHTVQHVYIIIATNYHDMYLLDATYVSQHKQANQQWG